jgi:hypothetical protein
MTHSETIKAAQLLKAIAKPFMSMGAKALRTGDELFHDVRALRQAPGATALSTPSRASQFASRLEQGVKDTDAWAATLNRPQRWGLAGAQSVAAAAPMVGTALLPAYMTPIWSGASAVGENIGQGANWMFRPENARAQMHTGAQDAMIDTYDMLQGQTSAGRTSVIDQFHAGSMAPQFNQMRRDMSGGGNPTMMADYLQRRAQSVMDSQKSSSLVKAANLVKLSINLRALWQGAKALGHGTPTSAGGLASKWGWRAAKGTALASTVPLGIGAIQGWTGADGAAQQAGGDIAVNEFQKNLQGRNGFERWALGKDPSLMMNEVDRRLPGVRQRYTDRNGFAFQPGILSNMQSAWNNPSFVSSDSTGSYTVPNPRQ